MSARGVRIVVGEGPSTRKGLLRFVLDGEGYDVVAEAATSAELARQMAVYRPDVVVLDDGIGATAVGMITDMSPNTKVVLVWPGAVVPIGGAARVEPSRVLQDLGPTVARLTGQPSATMAGRGAALLESAANDPDVLRAMLLGGMVATGEPIIDDREPAPVVILPLTPTIDHDDLILNVPEAEPAGDDRSGAAVAAGTATVTAIASSSAARGRAVGAQSALNRRLGNLALGGAAVASAIVLALALGGTSVQIDGIRGLGLGSSSPSVGPQIPGPTVTPPPDEGPDGNGPNEQAPTGPGSDEGGGSLSTPDISLAGNLSPAPPPAPVVGVDPIDIGDGGGPTITPGSSTGGGDSHGGSDSGGGGGAGLDRGGNGGGSSGGTGGGGGGDNGGGSGAGTGDGGAGSGGGANGSTGGNGTGGTGSTGGSGGSGGTGGGGHGGGDAGGGGKDIEPTSSTEPPATEQPATEQPATEQPATEQPATEQPATEQLSTLAESAAEL